MTMTRDELVSNREYWITKIQLDLYQEIETFMAENNLTRTQLAERLGVTKGYMSQVLNGDFDHKISKLVDLALAVGKAPKLTFTELNEHKGNELDTQSSDAFTFTVTKPEQNQRFFLQETQSVNHQSGWFYESFTA